MQIACLDLEGVLVPEIWTAVADHTNNKALRATTRDVMNYRELMELRLREINKEQLRFSDIMSIVNAMKPFAGASAFLDTLRTRFQPAILSDTFYEFAAPLMRHLGTPFLLCHRLQIENDRIIGYVLRQEDPKRKVVEAFQSLNYIVVAAGDSLNDCGMLETADCGVLFRAADTLKERFPDLQATEEYDALYSMFVRHIDG